MVEYTTARPALTEAAVVAAARERAEPDWLVELRAGAARAAAALPMPTPRLRPWKYTDVSDLDLGAFDVVAPTVAISGDAAAGDLLATIAKPGVAAALGRLVPATEGAFIAANAAQWERGVAVVLPAGHVVSEPIVVEVTVDADAPAIAFPRLLVLAAERSEATIVVRLRSGDAPLVVAGVAEIEAHADAHVRIVVDERWGAETRDFTTVRSRIDRHASVLVSTLALGGRLVKHTVEALLEGEGARSAIRGVALGDEEQHFDFVTLQDHVAPHTESDVEIKAALAGASRSIYYGVTRVEETASGAKAEQVNRNLLLSGRAKADSDPVLEILTSQVIRCGHGATVGPVDDEALFYLQSRGLTERQALQLLVSGFFRSVTDGFAVPGLDEEIEAAVVAKLATAEL